jgi:hypothetical protein
LIPCLILPDGSTRPLRAGDPRAESCYEYVLSLNAAGGLDTRCSHEARDGWSFVRLLRGAK